MAETSQILRRARKDGFTSIDFNSIKFKLGCLKVEIALQNIQYTKEVSKGSDHSILDSILDEIRALETEYNEIEKQLSELFAEKEDIPCLSCTA